MIFQVKFHLHVVKTKWSEQPLIEDHPRTICAKLCCCPFLGSGSLVVVLLFIITHILGDCNCSMFCCTLLYVPSSFAIILMGKRELAGCFA